jgi:ParB family chromosome partitioning protein
MNISYVHINDLVEPAANARRKMDKDKLAELMRSIIADGVLQNLLGKRRGDGKIEVVAGARRLRATQMAIECLVEADPDRAESLVAMPVRILTPEEAENAEILQLVENLQRESMSIRDEVDGLGRLVSAGMSVESVAERTGLNPKYVTDRVLLRRLPESLMAALEAGKVQIRACEHVARVPGSKEREELAVRVLRSEAETAPLTADEVLEIIRDEYVMPLEGVIFGPETEVPEYTFPKCIECPYRVVRQRVGAFCSNLGCLRAKATAHFLASVATPEEAAIDRDLVQHWTGPGGTLTPEAPYLPLGSPVPPKELGHYNEVPWSVYLDEKVPGWREEIKIFRVVHPRSGVMHEVVDKGALRLLIKGRSEAVSAVEPSVRPEDALDDDSYMDDESEVAGSKERPSGGGGSESRPKTMEGGDLEVYRDLISAVAMAGGDVLSLPGMLRHLGHVLLMTMSPVDLRRWCEACGVDISVESPLGAMTTAIEFLHPTVREGWVLSGILIRSAAHASTASGLIGEFVNGKEAA